MIVRMWEPREVSVIRPMSRCRAVGEDEKAGVAGQMIDPSHIVESVPLRVVAERDVIPSSSMGHRITTIGRTRLRTPEVIRQ